MRYDIVKLGKNIRTLRKLNKLSCEKLGQQVGLSTSYIGLTERGQRSMATEKLCRVCEILNVTLDQLIAGNFEGGEAADIGCVVRESGIDNTIEKIIKNLESMDENHLNFILNMTKELLLVTGSDVSEEDDEDEPVFYKRG